MLWEDMQMGQYWQRPTEDMSCRAAAWGPQWAHWADTETVRLATTTWRRLLVRGRFKEPGFCLLCSHCLPVRGWAPKENKSSGSPDVCISVCARCVCNMHVLSKHTHLTIQGECFMMFDRNKNLKRKGISDFMERVVIFKNTRSGYAHSVTCSFMLAQDVENGLVSLATLVLAAPKITHRCWQKQYYVRFLRISPALEDWGP